MTQKKYVISERRLPYFLLLLEALGLHNLDIEKTENEMFSVSVDFSPLSPEKEKTINILLDGSESFYQ